jgi:hypothetical protein
MKLKQTDVVAIVGIILAVTFAIAFFKCLADEENERWNRLQAKYLKVTKGIPQVNIPN